MDLKVTLVDVNPKMVAAWREVFEDEADVTVVHGSMLDQKVDAWVTPTNSKANMDGGLDGAIRKYLGARIQTKVQGEVAKRYQGTLRVGFATCVETGVAMPRYLISTPTMHAANEDVSDTLNVALAAAAALFVADEKARELPGSLQSIALPGLGANTGRVPVEICADLMWTAYDLVRNNQFRSFAEVRAALEGALGDLGNVAPAKAISPAPKAQPHYPAPVKGPPVAKGGVVVPMKPAATSVTASAPKVSKKLDDFDDHE